MSTYQAPTIFESDLIRVEDFRCRGAHAHKSSEEWTDAHQIVFPRQGMYVRHDERGKIIADPHQVLFFHAQQPYEVSHPIKGGDRSTVLTLNFTILIEILRFFDPYVIERQEKPFPIGYMPVDIRQRYLQYQLFHTTASSNALEDIEVEERLIILLTELIGGMYTSLNLGKIPMRPDIIATHTEIVEQVKLILGERFREKIKLEDIAKLVHCSVFHLSRVFKKQAGLPIHRYIQNLRLLQALEQLAENPAIDFTNLGHEIGFSSHSHFSTAFKRKFDCAPSEFRFNLKGQKINEMSKILKV